MKDEEGRGGGKQAPEARAMNKITELTYEISEGKRPDIRHFGC